MSSTRRERAELAASVAFIALGLVIRLLYLRTVDLWGDEAVSWQVGAGDLAALGRRIVDLERAKPPLYFLILHFWMGLFGDSETSMRALSALLWPPLGVLMMAIGKRCCGRWTPLAVFLGALSPLLVSYGMEARPYALLACAEAWLVLLVMKALESDRLSLRVWLAAASLTILLIQFTGLLFVLPVLGYYLVRKRNDRRELLRTLGFQAGAAVLYGALILATLPDILSRFGEQHQAWWAPAPSIVQVISTPLRLLAPVSSWHFYTDWSRLRNPLLFAGVIVLAAAAAAGLAKSPSRGILIAGTAGVMALFIAYSVTKANLLFPRYYIGCAPLLLIAVAAALQWAAATAPRVVWVLLPAVAAAQIAVLATLPPLENTPAYGKAVEAVLARETGPLTLVSGGWDRPALRYYTRNAAARVSLREYAGEIPALLDGRPDFYYLESVMWGERPPEMRKEFARLDLDLRLVYEGGGTSVYQVVRRPPRK